MPHRTPRLSAQEKQWRAQDDIRTLTQAEAIRSDPGRMAEAKKHATQQVRTLTKVSGKPAKT